jgi:hypothetical protein
LFENALKLTYGNVEFKKFPGDPRTPRSKGKEREGEKSGRGVGRGGEERGVGEGKGGRKGRWKRRLQERERKERGEKGGRERERNLEPPIFETDQRHCLPY